jgi:uncharacterized protein GlcG (DUF336 family)
MRQTGTTPATQSYGPPIQLADALVVIAAATLEAENRAWPMAIAVADSGGHLVALHRLDQTQHASISLACEKAKCAVDFRRPTAVMESALATGGVNLRLLSMSGALPVAGGVPLIVDGKIVGAIGVSGMQAAEDEVIAQAGAAALSAVLEEAGK